MVVVIYVFVAAFWILFFGKLLEKIVVTSRDLFPAPDYPREKTATRVWE